MLTYVYLTCLSICICVIIFYKVICNIYAWHFYFKILSTVLMVSPWFCFDVKHISVEQGQVANKISLVGFCILPDEVDGSSDEDVSGGEIEALECQRSNEDRELKDKLLRKYSGYISSLKHEFSKKKKKGKLPKEARQILLEWWNVHYKWPYPTVSISWKQWSYFLYPDETVAKCFMVRTSNVLPSARVSLSQKKKVVLGVMVAQWFQCPWQYFNYAVFHHSGSRQGFPCWFNGARSETNK